MIRTSRKGPFSIVRDDGDLVVIQSKLHFTPERTSKIEVEQDGVMWRTRPFVLHRGDKVVISAVGVDDVVIDGGGDAA